MLKELWTEKYRPKSFDDIILPEQEKDNIYRAVKSGNIPHYLFIGAPGTGKTSLALVIINELKALSEIINASEERGIDVIREKVMRFVHVSTDKPKIVFLDEADSLTGEAQASLRNVMETYSNQVRFILTGNYDKFISPIKDRCEVVKFKQLSKEDCLKVLRKIVVLENIELKKGDELEKIIDKFYPSIRRMISILQKFSIPTEFGYELEIDNLENDTDELDYNKIWNERKNLYRVREIINEFGIVDFTPVYKFFFSKCIENNDEIGAVLVTEFMYRDSFVADKELNFISMILSLNNRIYPFIIEPYLSNLGKENQIKTKKIQNIKQQVNQQTIFNETQKNNLLDDLNQNQSQTSFPFSQSKKKSSILELNNLIKSKKTNKLNSGNKNKVNNNDDFELNIDKLIKELEE